MRRGYLISMAETIRYWTRYKRELSSNTALINGRWEWVQAIQWYMYQSVT